MLKWMWIGLLVVGPVRAGVITGSHLRLSDEAAVGDYVLTVFQDEAGSDDTSIWVELTGSRLAAVDINLDEGSDWYLATLNEEFSAASIADGRHPVLLQVATPYVMNEVEVGSGEFYLGVNTSQGEARDVYGWARLRNDGGSLVLLDSAMAYGGSGIYIGTTQQVPEPSSALLLVVGFAGLLYRRRCGGVRRAG
jgi:hypothetical protein